MSRFIDRTGQKFGMLTAISLVRNGKAGSHWIFQCDCGNKKEFPIRRVAYNKSKNQNCGCINIKLKDITGHQFNFLHAVRFVRVKKNRTFWLFKCVCGNEKEIDAGSVSAGRTKSCGCMMANYISKAREEKMIGKRVGAITIIKRTKQVGGFWFYECLCDCGKSFEQGFHEPPRKSCGCAISVSGENHYNWNGGKRVRKSGYIQILISGHPFSTRRKNSKGERTNKGYVLEHRLVMEKHIGRFLLSHENVHHKNGIKGDNRIENLELWTRCQPSGQRAKDLVDFAREVLAQYGELFPE